MPINRIPLVGPPVPEDIQLIRQARRQKILAENDVVQARPEKPTALDQDTKDCNDESESEDEFLGPQLSKTSDTLPEDDEKSALERLKTRSEKDQNLTNKKEDAADRSNWMAYALGQKVDNDQNASYNPKTLRRNVALGNAKNDGSSTETETERAKRLADEMMGLGEASKTSKKVKTSNTHAETKDDSEDEAYFSVRRSQPSLLEQHLQNKDRDRKPKKGGKNKDDKFDWNRDIKGNGLGSRKIQEIVNQAKGMNSRFARGSK